MKSSMIWRFGFFGVLVAFALTGCGGSPTSPSGGNQPIGSGIMGTVMNTSSQALSGMRVTVASTGQSTTTNNQGQFRLMNTPRGTVQMTIQRGAVNTSVTVPNVGSGQMVQMTVMVDANGNAQVMNMNSSSMPQFDGYVVAVDQTAQTLTLQGGYVIQVDANTVFSNDADDDSTPLQSLADIANALAAGQMVEAEGYGMPAAAAGGPILAAYIEAEVDTDGGTDSDD